MMGGPCSVYGLSEASRCGALELLEKCGMGNCHSTFIAKDGSEVLAKDGSDCKWAMDCSLEIPRIIS